MIIEYPHDKFKLVKDEILIKWEDISSEHIFYTPSDSNIIGYELFKWQDTKFPNMVDLITHIKKNKQVFSIILYIYKPFSRTNFHSDPSKFRYVYPIISNELCFNYELLSNISYSKLNNDFFEIDTMDKLQKFNDEFTKNGNKILNWDAGKTYLIGSNIHSHLNFSNNLRIALVIDTRENLI